MFWVEAIETERAAATRTLDCAINDTALSPDSMPANFKWGYKNPRHIYLMPVLDEAFNGKQKMVAVARDFRDLCSGSNRGQMRDYFHDVAPSFPHWEASRSSRKSQAAMVKMQSQSAVKNVTAPDFDLPAEHQLPIGSMLSG